MLNLLGWQWQSRLPADLRRYVLIAVPHTSNWDFFYALLTFQVMRIPVRFTIKDTVMVFPISYFLRALGAIPINRRPIKQGEERLSMVHAMSKLFSENEELALIVTPEATRSRRTEWKLGFYHIALRANVPIVLGSCDFQNKIIAFNHILYPTGDLEKDMREVMAYYRPIIHLGKNPELSALDERYS